MAEEKEERKPLTHQEVLKLIEELAPREKLEPILNRNCVLRLIEANGGSENELDLSEMKFERGINLNDINLKNVNLTKARLVEAHLEGAKLREAHLEEANLRYAHLERADLSEAHLRGASLMKANLEMANLRGANLEDANLEEADLSYAHLEGASLFGSNLERAYLFSGNLKKVNLNRANLKWAHLDNTHLEEAHLSEANLEGACLWDTHLEGANLMRTHLQGANLMRTKFSSDVNLEDVDWGNYILDEEKPSLFDSAVASYRHLKVWYSNAGYNAIAAKFYYREMEARRKEAKWSWNPNVVRHRLALEALRALFGYGEHWERVLYWMALVVFGSAAAYYLSGELSLLYSLYFSVISFTALGYGKWVDIIPAGWVQALGAFQSLTGVFTMALLLVTFVRKWTR